MTYKKGDIVWYLDTTLDVPRIKKDLVIGIIGDDLYRIKESIRAEYYREYRLFPTKEALLAAIDPPLHDFVVGQTVWYIEDSDDPNTLRVDKATVHSTTNETVVISVSGIATFHITLDILFDNPQDAVTKALELKQW